MRQDPRKHLALHAEAAGVDDPRRLPQGEERRQAFGLLQAGGRLRRGLRVGAAARLRDRAVAVGIHRLERVPYRREGAVDADRPLGMRRVEDRQRTRKTARLAARRDAAHHRPRHRAEHRHLARIQQFRAVQGRTRPRHGARAAHRRPLRPQPQGESAAGDRSGAVRAVPATVRTQLPLLARAAAGGRARRRTPS